MRLIIEKHVPGIFNEVTILNAEGELIYYVDSHLLLTKRMVTIFDEDDVAVGKVMRVEPSFEPTFQIFIDGELVGELVKEFTFFEPRVHIVSLYGPIISQGDMNKLEFSLTDPDGQIMAIVSEEFVEDDAFYGVEVADDIDEAFMIGLLMCIDMLLNE